MIFPSQPNWRANVLIVDDDPTCAASLAGQVEHLGHAVTIASSWTEAVRTFDRESFDLVLMDAVMPGVDGFKLTHMLRGRSTSYVPILFVTGLGDTRSRERGIHAGADDFLAKPVDDFELRVRLTAMLRIRRLTMDLEAKGKALEEMAHIDELTGIGNRRRFENRLSVELSRARRYEHPLSLLVCDIDHFKLVNDRFGHAVGDEVLQFFGDLLGRQLRGPDVAFRYGGEEFVVLTPETKSAGAKLLADRLREVFEQDSSTTTAGRRTISIGVSGTDLLGPEVAASQLFETADKALYRAKQSGRNRVCVHEDRHGRSGAIKAA